MKLSNVLGAAAFSLAAVLAVGAVTPASADLLFANDELVCGDSLYSDNGNYRLHCQRIQYQPGQYSWVLFRSWEGPGPMVDLWTSWEDETYSPDGFGNHTDQTAVLADPGRAAMQGDGNFVLYNDSLTSAKWATNTNGNPGAYLNMQNDGNIVIYSASDSPLWSVFGGPGE